MCHFLTTNFHQIISRALLRSEMRNSPEAKMPTNPIPMWESERKNACVSMWAGHRSMYALHRYLHQHGIHRRWAMTTQATSRPVCTGLFNSPCWTLKILFTPWQWPKVLLVWELWLQQQLWRQHATRHTFYITRALCFFYLHLEVTEFSEEWLLR